MTVLAVCLAVSCADTAPTRPTELVAPAGVPVGLTLNVTPSEVPHLGGNVILSAAVDVQEGTQAARVPVLIDFALEDMKAPITNEYRTDANGRIRELFFVARAADFTVRVGAFKQRAHVSAAAAPPLPEPPPPPGPPAPAPKPPEPPPVPSMKVTLSAAPQTAILVGGATSITFTANATPLNGAGAIIAYAWDFDGDGKDDPGEVTSTGIRAHTYTAAGVRTVAVRATATSGVTWKASVMVAIASAIER